MLQNDILTDQLLITTEIVKMYELLMFTLTRHYRYEIMYVKENFLNHTL